MFKNMLRKSVCRLGLVGSACMNDLQHPGKEILFTTDTATTGGQSVWQQILVWKEEKTIKM